MARTPGAADEIEILIAARPRGGGRLLAFMAWASPQGAGFWHNPMMPLYFALNPTGCAGHAYCKRP